MSELIKNNRETVEAFMVSSLSALVVLAVTVLTLLASF